MEAVDSNVLQITVQVALPLAEISFDAIRAQGPGGQNVNKVSSAIHLRFNIVASSLPELCKQRLLALADQRITKDGVIVIKAQHSRSQMQNKLAALKKLQVLIAAACIVPTVRKATRPSRSSQLARLENKLQRGRVKAMRGKAIDGG